MRNILKTDINPLLKLAIPLALTGLAQSGAGFFTTLFLARLGEKTLAAGALVTWFFATLIVILFGTLSSINVLVSHKHGAKDPHSISLIARDGFFLAFLLGILSFLLLWNMSPIFLLLGQPESIVVLANSYLRAISFGIPASFLGMACIEVTIGIGLTRIVLIYSILATLLNIFLSYIFIFGKFGFPALGISGAGWGSSLECWITFIFLAIYVYLNQKLKPYFKNSFKISKPVFLMELIRVGFPIGLMYCFEVAFFFVLTLSVGILGTQAQAANQVALQYLCLLMTMIFAVAQAITVRMGHLIGAKEIQSAQRASQVGVGLSIIFMIFIGCFYVFTPSLLIWPDFNLHDPKNFSIIEEIKKFLLVCAIFQIVESARVALFGSLRALKDTRFTMLTSILSFWGIALPLGFFFVKVLHFDGTGFWWAMITGAGLSVFLLQKRFKSRIRRFS